MRRYTETQCVIFILCFFLLDYYLSQRVYPQEKASLSKENKESLCVTIWPKKTRILTGGSFQINVRVVNAAEKSQFICVRGSHVIQWKTDNTRVLLEGGIAFSDHVRTLLLEPGEAYETTVELRVEDSSHAKLISFRMAFTPDDFLIPLPPLSGKEPSVASSAKVGSSKAGAAPKKREIRIYWSNKVVLGIKDSKRE